MAYSLIVVVLLACLLGKDAAGVAAVALTALAAAIFKQFETLRFRQIPERESTVIFVQRLYSWYLLLLMFSFYGLSVVFWVLPGTLSHKVWRHSPAGYINYISLLLLVLSQFVGGFISGKTAPARRYSYAVFASVGVVFVNIIIQITESGFRDAIDALYAYISVHGNCRRIRCSSKIQVKLSSGPPET